jgi:hypothetical protein
VVAIRKFAVAVRKFAVAIAIPELLLAPKASDLASPTLSNEPLEVH